MKTLRLSTSGALVYLHLYGRVNIVRIYEGWADLIVEVPEADVLPLMQLVREEEYACNLRMIASGFSPAYSWIDFPIEGHASHCSCRACMSGTCGGYMTDLFEDHIVWKE